MLNVALLSTFFTRKSARMSMDMFPAINCAGNLRSFPKKRMIIKNPKKDIGLEFVNWRDVCVLPGGRKILVKIIL